MNVALKDEKGNRCGYQHCHNNQRVFEEKGSQVDSLTEGRAEITVTLLVEHGPKASNQLKPSDFVEEKVGFVIERIGDAHDLKVGDKFSAYYFMAQTEKKYPSCDVGNRPEYRVCGFELFLVLNYSQRLSFRHRIEGESNVWALNDRSIENKVHAAGHPFQVGCKADSKSQLSVVVVDYVRDGFVDGAIKFHVGAEIHFLDVEEGGINCE